MVSKKQLILNTLNESDMELFPRQIHERTGINHATVRKYLRSLLAEGKVLQPYTGSYASKITYGMMLAPLRCHHVVVQVTTPWLKFSDETTEWTGDVKLRIQYGLQRRRVTGFFSVKKGTRGMDQDTLLFVLQRFYDLFEKRTGRVVEDVIVKTFEFNRDVTGVRVDGVKCFTRTSLNGFLERIYQKGDVARAEVKVSQEMGVSQFEALIRGGVPYAENIQAQYLLGLKMGEILKSQKFTNRLLQNVAGLMKEVVKRVGVESEVADLLRKVLKKLEKG